jgi:hypothetical protein
MSSKPFECPTNSEIYFDQVVKRCRRFVSIGLWTINPTALDGWISNFASAEEKHMAACLLDGAIFRDERQVKAMILQLLQRTLSDALADPCQFGLDWQASLADELNDPGIRIIPVIRDDDSPAKSGPLVARLYRRHGGVSDKWMIWPWTINKAIRSGTKTFLLIDDFVGSGQQFIKFAKRFRLPTLDNVRIIYAPLIAHPKGIFEITSKFPKVLLVPGEVLPKKANLSGNDSETFDNHNTMQSACKLYDAYWRRCGISLNRNLRYGWDKLGLALSFNHGTPNATLPLFWLNEGPHKAVFSR